MRKDPGAINGFRNVSGFTLVELLIVMAIIGILAAIAFPRVDQYMDKARAARAQSDIDCLFKAMVLLEADTGLWPGHQTVNQINQNGGNEVWNFAAAAAGLRTSDGGYPNWNGPYMSSIPLDPWGNRYFLDTDYMIDGQWRVVLGSFGPNGCCPNQYDSDDVIKVLW